MPLSLSYESIGFIYGVSYVLVDTTSTLNILNAPMSTMFGAALSGAFVSFGYKFIGAVIDEFMPDSTKPYVLYALAVTTLISIVSQAIYGSSNMEISLTKFLFY